MPRYNADISWSPEEPSFGDELHVTATDVPPYSFVHIQCYQNGEFVLDAYRGLTDTASDFGEPITLSNTFNDLWNEGAAHCILTAGYWPQGRWRELDVEEIDVSA